MKFVISSSVLLKNLQAISGAQSSNATLPILENFLFDFKDKKLAITATDLETTMTASVALEMMDGELKIALPAKLLMDTLKTFPDQPLTFDIKKNFGVEIISQSGKYKLAGQDGKEFPEIPVLDKVSSVEIDSISLANAIHKTIFATGNDELRRIMTGVLLELNESEVTFVATDAHKLVRHKRNDVKSKKSAQLVLPKKPLNLLKNALSGIETKVKLEYNEANAVFKFDNYTLTCRLIDGKYPNYDAVIPKENPFKLTVDRTNLLNSIKRVSIFSNKTTHQVRLKISGSELSISAEDIDFQNEANERLTCQYNGDDMEIGFNSRFLVEMLQNVNTENINIEMSGPNRAGIIMPAEKVDNDEELLMLVMPVMLNNN